MLSGFDGLFEDVTARLGLVQESLGVVGWGTALADFDLDGDLDLSVVNGFTSPAGLGESSCVQQMTQLWVRQPKRFDNVDMSNITQPIAGRGLAAGDLDDDGDIDLVLTSNNGEVLVLKNLIDERSWLKVEPRSRMVVGTHITVKVENRRMHRVVTAGESYLSSSAGVVHFGLGQADSVDLLVVRFPNGTIVRMSEVAAGQTLVVDGE
jgi:hypothetical protein